MGTGWDERKRGWYLQKHALDFRDAAELFEYPYLLATAREVTGERREIALGLVRGRCVALVFTRREGRIRCISMRRARDEEREAYEERFGPPPAR
jgi:uncharacterized DUF497 family protein